MAESIGQANLDVSLNLSPAEQQLRGFERTRNLKFNLDTTSFRPLGKITGDVAEFERSMAAANARVLAFGSAAAVIAAVGGTLRAFIKDAIEVEKTMTAIQVVTNSTSSDLSKLGNGLFEIGKKTGQSFLEAATAAKEFARQGLGLEETLKRTRDALILTRLTGIDAADAVRVLTAGVNSFSKEALSTTDIINRFANVSSSFAVSAKDLAEGITRVSTSAEGAKVGFNELTALITSLQQTTQRGGAVIGNALKSIFTRVERPETLDQLERLGIAVRDVQGNVLPAITILQQLGKTFDHLTDTQKSYVAQLVGGLFQVNQLRAGLSDLGSGFSVYSRALDAANNSTDEAIKRNDALNKTIAALINEAGVNFTKLGSIIGKDAFGPAIKNSLGAFNAVVDTIGSTKLGEQIGGAILKGIGTTLGSTGLTYLTFIAGKLLKNFFEFTTKSVQSIAKSNVLTKDQQSLQGGINALLAQDLSLRDKINNRLISTAEKELAINNALRQRIGIQAEVGAVGTKITQSAFGAGYRFQGNQFSNKQMPSFSSISDAMSREQSAIGPSEKPVLSYSHMLNSPVVVNSGQIKKYGGNADTIIQRDHIGKGQIPSIDNLMKSGTGLEQYRVPNFAGTFLDNLTPEQLQRLIASSPDIAKRYGVKSNYPDILDSPLANPLPYSELNELRKQAATLGLNAQGNKLQVQGRINDYYFGRGSANALVGKAPIIQAGSFSEVAAARGSFPGFGQAGYRIPENAQYQAGTYDPNTGGTRRVYGPQIEGTRPISTTYAGNEGIFNQYGIATVQEASSSEQRDRAYGIQAQRDEEKARSLKAEEEQRKIYTSRAFAKPQFNPDVIKRDNAIKEFQKKQRDEQLQKEGAELSRQQQVKIGGFIQQQKKEELLEKARLENLNLLPQTFSESYSRKFGGIFGGSGSAEIKDFSAKFKELGGDSTREREIIEGVKQNTLNSVRGKRGNAAFGLSFAAPLAAGALSESFTDPRNQRAAQGIGGGIGAGASIAALSSGNPYGIAIGAVVGSFQVLKSVLDNLTPSLEDLSKKAEELSAKQGQQLQSASNYVEAQNGILEAIKSGANPSTIKSLNQQSIASFQGITDPELRTALLGAKGTEGQTNVLRDFGVKFANQKNASNLNLDLTGLEDQRSGFGGLISSRNARSLGSLGGIIDPSSFNYDSGLFSGGRSILNNDQFGSLSNSLSRVDTGKNLSLQELNNIGSTSKDFKELALALGFTQEQVTKVNQAVKEDTDKFAAFQRVLENRKLEAVFKDAQDAQNGYALSIANFNRTLHELGGSVGVANEANLRGRTLSVQNQLAFAGAYIQGQSPFLSEFGKIDAKSQFETLQAQATGSEKTQGLNLQARSVFEDFSKTPGLKSQDVLNIVKQVTTGDLDSVNVVDKLKEIGEILKTSAGAEENKDSQVLAALDKAQTEYFKLNNQITEVKQNTAATVARVEKVAEIEREALREQNLANRFGGGANIIEKGLDFSKINQGLQGELASNAFFNPHIDRQLAISRARFTGGFAGGAQESFNQAQQITGITDQRALGILGLKDQGLLQSKFEIAGIKNLPDREAAQKTYDEQKGILSAAFANKQRTGIISNSTGLIDSFIGAGKLDNTEGIFPGDVGTALKGQLQLGNFSGAISQIRGLKSSTTLPTSKKDLDSLATALQQQSGFYNQAGESGNLAAGKTLGEDDLGEKIKGAFDEAKKLLAADAPLVKALQKSSDESLKVSDELEHLSNILEIRENLVFESGKKTEAQSQISQAVSDRRVASEQLDSFTNAQRDINVHSDLSDRQKTYLSTDIGSLTRKNINDIFAANSVGSSIQNKGLDGFATDNRLNEFDEDNLKLLSVNAVNDPHIKNENDFINRVKSNKELYSSLSQGASKAKFIDKDGNIDTEKYIRNALHAGGVNLDFHNAKGDSVTRDDLAETISKEDGIIQNLNDSLKIFQKNIDSLNVAMNSEQNPAGSTPKFAGTRNYAMGLLGALGRESRMGPLYGGTSDAVHLSDSMLKGIGVRNYADGVVVNTGELFGADKTGNLKVFNGNDSRRIKGYSGGVVGISSDDVFNSDANGGTHFDFRGGLENQLGKAGIEFNNTNANDVLLFLKLKLEENKRFQLKAIQLHDKQFEASYKQDYENLNKVFLRYKYDFEKLEQKQNKSIGQNVLGISTGIGSLGNTSFGINQEGITPLSKSSVANHFDDLTSGIPASASSRLKINDYNNFLTQKNIEHAATGASSLRNFGTDLVVGQDNRTVKYSSPFLGGKGVEFGSKGHGIGILSDDKDYANYTNKTELDRINKNQEFSKKQQEQQYQTAISQSNDRVQQKSVHGDSNSSTDLIRLYNEQQNQYHSHKTQAGKENLQDIGKAIVEALTRESTKENAGKSYANQDTTKNKEAGNIASTINNDVDFHIDLGQINQNLDQYSKEALKTFQERTAAEIKRISDEVFKHAPPKVPDNLGNSLALSPTT